MYIWEVPRSGQESSERYDLTFNVWDGEEAGCILIGGASRAKVSWHPLAVLVLCTYYSFIIRVAGWLSSELAFGQYFLNWNLSYVELDRCYFMNFGVDH